MRRPPRLSPISALLFAFLLLHHSPSYPGLEGHEGDPVVLNGAQLPSLLSVSPARLVGFRYDSGWTQIPVQVDERAWNDYGRVYGSTPVGLTILAYCDSLTYMGADPVPSFDDDDELVLMAKDAGTVFTGGTSYPAGVIPGTCVQLEITDTLTSQHAFVYLFESDGTLLPGADTSYVGYAFNLLSGSYLQTYNTNTGPNPEDTDVSTPFYGMHFSDRWICDEIEIYAGGAAGVDILDRHKDLFAPGNCSRSENTFSAGEGAFFANKNGPVRAIRSYMGANSGPFTQREHFFYESRYDVTTYLRVHAITGMLDFYDYGPGGNGMTYYNDLNPGGVTIDGSPAETVTPGQIVWEMVTGAQGTLIIAHSVETDIPGFLYTSYYLDDTSPPVTQCTGDAWAYGSSGLWINQGIPNTDPYLGTHNSLAARRVVYIDGPGQDVTLAEIRYEQAISPLVVTPTQVIGLGPGPAPYREPTACQLEQSYPNPFNPACSIRYGISRPGRVSMQVFDSGGAFVRVLFDGWREPGVYSEMWDGRAEGGRELPSGVYICRLEADDFVDTRKIVLLK